MRTPTASKTHPSTQRTQSIRLIDDADWGHVVRLLKDAPLTKREQRWYTGFAAAYTTYLQERTPMTIGMTVSEREFRTYDRITRKYPSTRAYRRWADQVMSLSLEEILGVA